MRLGVARHLTWFYYGVGQSGVQPTDPRTYSLSLETMFFVRNIVLFRNYVGNTTLTWPEPLSTYSRHVKQLVQWLLGRGRGLGFERGGPVGPGAGPGCGAGPDLLLLRHVPRAAAAAELQSNGKASLSVPRCSSPLRTFEVGSWAPQGAGGGADARIRRILTRASSRVLHTWDLYAGGELSPLDPIAHQTVFYLFISTLGAARGATRRFQR
jgi:hypothetical protein